MIDKEKLQQKAGDLFFRAVNLNHIRTGTVLDADQKVEVDVPVRTRSLPFANTVIETEKRLQPRILVGYQDGSKESLLKNPNQTINTGDTLEVGRLVWRKSEPNSRSV